MTVDMSQFYEVFFEEAAEHLASMETLLLKLDVNAPDPDDLNAIFRAAHSIKGGSGTFGFTDMTEVTHILENLLDRLRKNELVLTQAMIDIFLVAGDVLKSQLDFHRGGAAVDAVVVAEICATLAQLTNNENAPAVAAAPAAVNSGAHAAKNLNPPKTRFHLAFKRVAKAKLENLLPVLALQGDLSAPQEAADSALQSFTFDTVLGESELWEMLEFVVSRKQVSIKVGEIIAASSESAEPEDEGFGLFLPEEELHAQLEAEQGFGLFEGAPGSEPMRNPGRREGDQSESVAVPGRRDNDRVAVAASAEASSIRVGVDKVDNLINLVGELVISQAMLAQTASRVDPVLFESLMTSVAQLERNTRDLQESVMSIRMLPISFVFNRFPRVVRDVATKLGKQVELVTIGEGTELDKGLIEKIADPLTHLVRNSLDHGIESPEKRSAAGKNPKGTLTLRASHQGGSIVIEVSDDGAGLSRERILAKAQERGLPSHEGMSDHEVWQMIFAPGFSTAEVVTDVSGRGVGMDVVKRNIEGMGGRVELASTPGAGAKVTIRLPLTLAILDGMSIAVGNEVFIIPLTYIVESLQPTVEDIKTISSSGQVVQVRGEYLPLVPLHSVFKIEAKAHEPHQGIIVIIESDDGKIALLVDALVGQHQVVIKSLEGNYRKVAAVSGATIMGDGRVALILDVVALVRGNQRVGQSLELGVAA